MKTFSQAVCDALKWRRQLLKCGCVFDRVDGWTFPCKEHEKYCSCAGVPPTMPKNRDRNDHLEGCTLYRKPEA